MAMQDTVKQVLEMETERPSSPVDCVICLERVSDKSFTNNCMHQFCYACLLSWSKVKKECPLCKQSFDIIIHNIRAIDDYDEYQVPEPAPAQFEPTFEIADTTSIDRFLNPDRRFFAYRTSSLTPGVYHLPNNEYHRSGNTVVFNPYVSSRMVEYHLNNRRSSRQNRSVRREDIYLRDADVIPPSDTGRQRLCTPEFYRENEAQIHRLVPWLTRELNTIVTCGCNFNVQEALTKIVSLLPVMDMKSEVFYGEIYPFTRDHTTRFLDMFHNFAVSPYDMVGYDRECIYVSRSNYSRVGIFHNHDFNRNTGSSSSRSSNNASNNNGNVNANSVNQSSTNNIHLSTNNVNQTNGIRLSTNFSVRNSSNDQRWRSMSFVVTVDENESEQVQVTPNNYGDVIHDLTNSQNPISVPLNSNFAACAYGPPVTSTSRDIPSPHRTRSSSRISGGRSASVPPTSRMLYTATAASHQNVHSNSRIKPVHVPSSDTDSDDCVIIDQITNDCLPDIIVLSDAEDASRGTIRTTRSNSSSDIEVLPSSHNSSSMANRSTVKKTKETKKRKKTSCKILNKRRKGNSNSNYESSSSELDEDSSLLQRLSDRKRRLVKKNSKSKNCKSRMPDKSKGNNKKKKGKKSHSKRTILSNTSDDSDLDWNDSKKRKSLKKKSKKSRKQSDINTSFPQGSIDNLTRYRDALRTPDGNRTAFAHYMDGLLFGGNGGEYDTVVQDNTQPGPSNRLNT